MPRRNRRKEPTAPQVFQHPGCKRCGDPLDVADRLAGSATCLPCKTERLARRTEFARP